MANFSALVSINAKSNLGKTGSAVSKSFDKMSRSAKRTSFDIDKLADNMLKLTRRAATLGAAGFGVAIRQGAKFQESIQDLGALTGLGADELGFVSKEAQKLGEQYGFSARKIIGAAKLVGSARSELLSSPTALLDITEQAIVLSKAASMELEPAVSSLMDTMNQFNVDSSESSRVVNVLAAGAKVGGAEVDVFSKSIIKAGVASRMVGVELEETTSALQVMAVNGLKGEMAGTALRSIFTKLATGGIDKFNPKLIGLNEALSNLEPYKDNASALKQLFGDEYVAVGKILIENRDKITEWTGAVTGTETAYEQATINMATASNRFKRIGSMIENDFINVFLDNEGDLMGMLDRLIAKFEEFRPIESMLTTVGDALKGTGAFFGGFGQTASSASEGMRAAKTFPQWLNAATGWSAFAQVMSEGFKGENSIFGDLPESGKTEVELRIHSKEDVEVERIDDKTDVFIFRDLGLMTP